MKSHSRHTAIFGIVFWTLFLASIGLADRYRWLDAMWFCVGWSFAAVASVLAIIERFRNRNTSAQYGGGPARSLQSSYYLPRWMMWVVLDDEQYAKYVQRRRVK